MAGRRTSSLHLGGPLGLAGLGMLAGAAGLIVFAGGERETSTGSETVSSTIAERERQGEVGTVTVQEVQVIDVAPQPLPLPGKAGPSAVKAPVTLPASAKGAEVTFIVRLKGQPEIDIISRNFKKDPDMAQKAYADLSERLPGLKDFQLVGASYSGEIKLAYQLAPGVEPTRSAIDDIKSRIMAIEGVAYADPDYVAHPGEDKR